MILPEDDSDQDVANGFRLHSCVVNRRIQVLNPAGGWGKVVEVFLAEHVMAMEHSPDRLMILLIDFDQHPTERYEKVRSRIPEHIAERVFVLGALDTPEVLKSAFKSRFTLEEIGLKLADDCHEGTMETWSHAHLKHNCSEFVRLRESAHPFLFS